MRQLVRTLKHKISDTAVDAICVRLMGPRQAPLLLAAIVGLGTILRVFGLGANSFGIDEAWSVAYARLPWGEFLNRVTTYEANMALYFLVLRGWLVLGASEAVLRAFSVVASVATLPVVYRLGTRLFGARTGLIAAFLLAISPFHIFWSQAARGYTLGVLFAALSCWYFLDYLWRPTRRTLFGYAVVSMLMVYTHFFGTLVLAAQWMAALLRPRVVALDRIVAAVAVSVPFLLPLGFFWLTRDVGQIDWVNQPTLRDVVHAAASLAGGMPVLALSAGLTLTAVGTVLRARPVQAGAAEKWSVLFLLMWLAVPALIALGVSVVKPLFVTRYLGVSLPPLVLLSALGVRQLPWGVGRTAVLSVLVALTVGSLGRAYAPASEDWRAVTRYVLTNAAPEEAVLFYAGNTRPAYEYYVERFRDLGQGPHIVFPPVALWPVRPDPTVQRAILDTVLEGLPRRYPRVWLVLSHTGGRRLGRPQVREYIEAGLSRHYAPTQALPFRLVEVRRYELRVSKSRR